MQPFSSSSSDCLLGNTDASADADEHPASTSIDRHAAFGGSETRQRVEKRLLQKLDLRVFFLVFVYALKHINRGNVAAARLQGLEEDLHMTGQQFNTLISILYVGYVPMQIPSNIFLNQIRKPSIYLSCGIFFWGVSSIWTGSATSFRAALLSRLFLGFTEAAYYPGALFMISRWYKHHEIGSRLVYFTCGSAASKIIGPPIASGILGTMDGIRGYAAWRWLFFIEGVLTCLVAAIALNLIPDFPTTPASWLTMEEQILAQERMVEDVYGIENDPLKSIPRSGLVGVATDWTVWWLAVAMNFLTVMLSFENFFPTLVATIGHGPIVSLLLCSPPWILGAATSLFIMRHSDATRERFWHVTVPVSMAIVGFTIAILSMNTAIRYLSLFFMAQSSVSYIISITWLSNSIPEPSKRAVAIAFINAFASLGDIGAPYFWIASWGPSYSKSYLICIFMAVIAIMMLWVYRLHLMRLNKQAEKHERTLGLPVGFRYII